jgi:hypothetical protein
MLKESGLQWRSMNACERLEQLLIPALSLIIVDIGMKFVILDAASTPAPSVAALGAVTLVLGTVCWQIRDRASRAPLAKESRREPGGR